MTEKEFRDRKDAMIEAEYAALGIETEPWLESTPEQDELVKERFVERVKAECERDPAFKQAWFLDVARQDVREWEADHRPIGAYRKDGILRLSEELRVFMPDATRDDLLSWALYEDDERNLAYIKSRLDLWDDHPECRTLAELEEAKR